MSALDYLTPEQVTTSDLLCTYIEQQTGTPWSSGKDIALFRKKCKEFFEHYPYLDYQSLVHVADWCRRTKRRYSHTWKVVDAFRYAYADGALPEVDHRRHVDPNMEAEIEEAITLETDDTWKRQLICTQNVQTRKEVLDNWRTHRKPLLTAV